MVGSQVGICWTSMSRCPRTPHHHCCRAWLSPGPEELHVKAGVPWKSFCELGNLMRWLIVLVIPRDSLQWVFSILPSILFIVLTVLQNSLHVSAGRRIIKQHATQADTECAAMRSDVAVHRWDIQAVKICFDPCLPVCHWQHPLSSLRCQQGPSPAAAPLPVPCLEPKGLRLAVMASRCSCFGQSVPSSVLSMAVGLAT